MKKRALKRYILTQIYANQTQINADLSLKASATICVTSARICVQKGFFGDLKKTLAVLILVLAGVFLCQASFVFALSTGKEVDKMLENLHWLGHASFRFDGAKIIYFDPWKLSKNAKKADIILISHEHFDHYSLEDIKLISAKDTVLVTDKTVSRQLEKAGVLSKEIHGLAPGDELQVSEVKINAVASYNTNKQFHTRDSHKLGFIVTIDGIKIYHAGDTDNIPEMKNYHCDIALLPVSGTYVMTADEAAQAALAIKPKVAVPMHYADIVGSSADAKRFQDLLKGRVEVRIMER